LLTHPPAPFLAIRKGDRVTISVKILHIKIFLNNDFNCSKNTFINAIEKCKFKIDIGFNRKGSSSEKQAYVPHINSLYNLSSGFPYLYSDGLY